jgi:hypothetical protein
MKIGFLLLASLITYSGVSNAQLSNLKFDVALRLDNYIISNVRDLDGTEDLYSGHEIFSGNTIGSHMRLDNAFISNTTIFDLLIPSKRNFFAIPKPSQPKRSGTYQINKQELIFKDLTLTQLKNIVLVVGGILLFDDEGMIAPRPFYCIDCNQQDQYKPCSRTIRFAEMSSTQTSINNLKDNGLPQALSFGADKYFELNYYENFKKEDGWVKFKWMVWVTPHN